MRAVCYFGQRIYCQLFFRLCHETLWNLSPLGPVSLHTLEETVAQPPVLFTGSCSLSLFTRGIFSGTLIKINRHLFFGKCNAFEIRLHRKMYTSIGINLSALIKKTTGLFARRVAYSSSSYCSLFFSVVKVGTRIMKAVAHRKVIHTHTHTRPSVFPSFPATRVNICLCWSKFRSRFRPPVFHLRERACKYGNIGQARLPYLLTYLLPQPTSLTRRSTHKFLHIMCVVLGY